MKFFPRFRLFVFSLCCGFPASAVHLSAAETNAVPRFAVRGYLVNDTTLATPMNSVPMLSTHTGANVGLDEIVRAAADLQAEYARRGYPTTGVAIGAREITNGFVTLHIFRSAVSQIRISGKRYEISSNEVVEVSNLMPPAATNAVSAAAVATEELLPPPAELPKPVSPEEEALRRKMAELAVEARKALFPPQPSPTVQTVLAPPVSGTNDVQLALHAKLAELGPAGASVETNAVVVSTNGPVFEVKGYELTGNTLLTTNLTRQILQPYIGTNVTFERIRSALTGLQTAYREHGYATVSVTLPQQTLSDKMVKIRVFEGRLTEIAVVNNRYFNSNNVMRALPSLHANMILTTPIFQAELDRANANQDRQIYPAIEPGFVEGTSLLKLDIKDRAPLHAKTELNNQSSPGTPELRVNSSAEYGNLWQLEHSLGVQYSFSPEKYKGGDWDFYDRPLVANYSGFYRMPLGNPESVANTLSAASGFGYDEATRKFSLPPPSGQAELNFFASRSTIDTGLETSPKEIIFDVPGVRQVSRQDLQQDLTINNAVGFQLTVPLPENDGLRSTFSAGVTYKSYELISSKTNTFQFSEITVNANGSLNAPIVSTVSSPVPVTDRLLDYLPVNVRWDGSKQDKWGVTAFGIGVAANAWHSGSLANLHNIAGSTNASGHWVTINPTASRDFNLPKNWTLSLHGEAQWSSEPLISNEQFGSGGVNSVRGYHEGEVFGDKGWRLDADLKTPAQVVGIVHGKQAMTVRASIFTDYSEVYLLDPQGRAGQTPLWDAGVGLVASIGTHWETRLLFAVPFEKTATTEPLRPKFNFSLTAQF